MQLCSLTTINDIWQQAQYQGCQLEAVHGRGVGLPSWQGFAGQWKGLESLMTHPVRLYQGCASDKGAHFLCHMCLLGSGRSEESEESS